MNGVESITQFFMDIPDMSITYKMLICLIQGSLFHLSNNIFTTIFIFFSWENRTKWLNMWTLEDPMLGQPRIVS